MSSILKGFFVVAILGSIVGRNFTNKSLPMAVWLKNSQIHAWSKTYYALYLIASCTKTAKNSK